MKHWVSLTTSDLRSPLPLTGKIRRSPLPSIAATSTDDPLLLRVARGEEAERAPVWLMRQAGRYMADFRKYSDKYAFRERSETPDIAVELSLQPYRSFGVDGVIMFSDILTPLPAIGVDFEITKGIGPRIEHPLRSYEDLKRLIPLTDPDQKLSFVGETLSRLREALQGTDATLVGFIGAPWTLAGYCIETRATKNCLTTKMMMRKEPELLHQLLQHLTDALIPYVQYQVESGAQIVQLFESWAHYLSPDQFSEFGLPYAEAIVQATHAKFPEVPVIYHMNGGTGKLGLMHQCSADVIGLDWRTDLGEAKQILGNRVIQGNLDPLELLGTEDSIKVAVERCLDQGGGQHHILNLGHGVIQETPEENVRLFCGYAKERSFSLRQAHLKEAQILK